MERQQGPSNAAEKKEVPVPSQVITYSKTVKTAVKTLVKPAVKQSVKTTVKFTDKQFETHPQVRRGVGARGAKVRADRRTGPEERISQPGRGLRGSDGAGGLRNHALSDLIFSSDLIVNLYN